MNRCLATFWQQDKLVLGARNILLQSCPVAEGTALGVLCRNACSHTVSVSVSVLCCTMLKDEDCGAWMQHMLPLCTAGPAMVHAALHGMHCPDAVCLANQADSQVPPGQALGGACQGLHCSQHDTKVNGAALHMAISKKWPAASQQHVLCLIKSQLSTALLCG